MRSAVAIAGAVLVLLGAAAPHNHAGALGMHGCAACVTRGAEPAADATPDVARAPLAEPLDAPAPVEEAPTCGAPLGAIPGQSPPAA